MTFRIARLLGALLKPLLLGEELIEWMINKLDIKDAEEALHLATFLCKYGYYFHATTNNSAAVKEDGELFRFQVRVPLQRKIKL